MKIRKIIREWLFEADIDDWQKTIESNQSYLLDKIIKLNKKND